MENYHLVTDDLTGDEPSASMDHSGISQPAMELTTLEGNPQLIILYILIQWIGKREIYGKSLIDIQWENPWKIRTSGCLR